MTNSEAGSWRSRRVSGCGAQWRVSRGRADHRHQRLRAQRGGPAAGDADGRKAVQPHHPQRTADRGGGAAAGAAWPGLGRGARCAGCGERLSRPPGRAAVAERAGECRAAGAAGDRAAVSGGVSGYQAGGDRRGQLRRHARGRLRCGHTLRRNAGAGHDRGADRATRAAFSRPRRRPPIWIGMAAPTIRARCWAMPVCSAGFPAAA